MCDRNLNTALFAVQKATAKHQERESLAPGSYECDITITGTVDANPVYARFLGSLSVGTDTVANSSSGPNQAELLAVVMGKLNSATREKITRELADAFSANGNRLPEVPAAQIEAAEMLLKRLRSTISQARKGTVSFKAAACSAVAAGKED
jgi:hypothetical protein